MLRKLFLIFIMALIISGLSACIGTQIKSSHPLIKESPDSLISKVYFIRPSTERYMGAADNRLEVEVDRFHLMDIAKGEYTLIPMVPGEVWITVKSLTAWGPKNLIKEMTRTTQFKFAPGQTYYIVFNIVDGEFRGAYFNTKAVDLYEAKRLTRHLRPVGRARSTPISSLRS